jgi:hypothetical protein
VIAWLSLFGAVVLTALAAWRFRHASPRRRHDPDWGDWPPDQMAQ